MPRLQPSFHHFLFLLLCSGSCRQYYIGCHGILSLFSWKKNLQGYYWRGWGCPSANINQHFLFLWNLSKTWRTCTWEYVGGLYRRWRWSTACNEVSLHTNETNEGQRPVFLPHKLPNTSWIFLHKRFRSIYKQRLWWSTTCSVERSHKQRDSCSVS